MKNRLLAILLVFCLLLAGCAQENEPAKKNTKKPAAEASEEQVIYERAQALLEEGNAEEAYKEFLSIPDYEDVSVYLADFTFQLITEQRTDYSFEDESGQTQSITYTYDTDGSLLSYAGHYLDHSGPDFSVNYQYAADGRVSQMKSLTEAGDSTVRYEYDAKGNLIRSVGVTLGADLGGISVLTYDSQGRCESINTTSYLAADPAQFTAENAYAPSQTIYEYGADGTVGKIYEFSEDALTYTYTFAYNDKKQVIQIIQLDADADYTITNFTYNQKGQCTQVENEYFTYLYAYDSAGNIAKETCIQNGRRSHEVEYTYRPAYQTNPHSPVPHPLDLHLGILDPAKGV